MIQNQRMFQYEPEPDLSLKKCIIFFFTLMLQFVGLLCSALISLPLGTIITLMRQDAERSWIVLSCVIWMFNVIERLVFDPYDKDTITTQNFRTWQVFFFLIKGCEVFFYSLFFLEIANHKLIFDALDISLFFLLLVCHVWTGMIRLKEYKRRLNRNQVSFPQRELLHKFEAKDHICDSEECSKCPCPICFEKMNSLVELECKHCFHEKCITPWYLKQPSCPVCRVSIV